MKPPLRLKATLLCFLCACTTIQAQSFEGTMSGKIAGNDVNLSIWIDLKVPPHNGAVAGSYFYKTIGKKISVSGKKDGPNIYLEEKDKNQKTTGAFFLSLGKGKLNGYWLKPNSKDTFYVEMYNANPSFKNTARIPKLKNLLAEDIEFYSTGLDSNDVYQQVTYSTLFARGNLLSVELNWENWSYTAHYGTIHHTYDLTTNETIKLEDEINDSCFAYLQKEVYAIVAAHREEYSDSAWIESIYFYMDTPEEYQQAKEKLNELFDSTTVLRKADFYLDKDGLICYIQDFCEQYYSAGRRDMTFDCSVSIPFDELRKYIKKDSRLSRIYYP